MPTVNRVGEHDLGDSAVATHHFGVELQQLVKAPNRIRTLIMCGAQVFDEPHVYL